MVESKYIERANYLSRYTPGHAVLKREAEARLEAEFTDKWLRSVREELPRFIPFLTRECGIEFRGRILEIGAGSAWFGAELSKLPNVVEVVMTDLSPRLLKEHAPRVFRLLKANTAKITRTPGDFHRLDFPANHFDFVVCSGVLHQAANILQPLREAKRVLKPGGHFVAIREPVSPLVSRPRRAQPSYTLADYREFFLHAGFPVEIKSVNLARGVRYLVNKLATA
ncbi:MAG TPA: class I SAM-dependent methyltransferase [Verrucomicrobia bacterium]|mgnify:CR=1 FL=1|nr:class I SAM-dependent methyltransferase [Verrucomicrobiota bacterium]HOB32337.1 class I SAM-dependent methyltransferase [Verrucomicrobiota bacterium]HOP96401.1 class I SAM-dependent methyltransferase [Verrucomicrobiota bacterium]